MIRVLLYALPVVLAIYALVDCIQTEDREVRGLPKLAWIALIVLFWVVGPVAWLVAGRARGATGTGRRAPWPAGPTAGQPDYERPRRTLAPDDDPEFLRQLQRSNQEHEKLLEKWEQDLRRREQEMRGAADADGATDGNNTGPDDRPEDEPPAPPTR
jgi:phospholipase D-like protein